MNYQRITLVGNAAGDAQIRKSKQGDITFTSFRIGIADRKNRTTFFPVVVFGKHVESLAKLVTKGRQVLVEGRLQLNENRFDVVADRIELGSSPDKQTMKEDVKPAEELENEETLVSEIFSD